MKLDTELQEHLRQVRLPAGGPEEAVPDGFVARVLAARAVRRERERAFTGVAALAAVLSIAALGWSGLRGPTEPVEPACLGWLEMDPETRNPWE